ncbi:3'-5' exonuclease [Nitzschia inconspicua]|uniref:3'-5' exonuclease n=1 Tax=Nitzschia inconspicua TaxID=303405 RepID=A0A9K3LAH2_9STRA|nr:3'-5' exonuclease [Nitzschia inconspicua]
MSNSTNLYSFAKEETDVAKLQVATEKLQLGCTCESGALALSLVFGALSLLQTHYENIDNLGLDAKAAASAMSSTTSRNKPLRHSGRHISIAVLRSYLIHATHTDLLSLQILNHFAKAFKLGGDDSIEDDISAGAIRHAMRHVEKSNDNILMDEEVDNNQLNLMKRRISGAFALACQLQPWTILSPETLVEAAIPLELWHAAEDICISAHKASPESLLPQNPSHETIYSQELQKYNAQKSVERLIDAAIEDRMYRRADALATSLYDAGGRSRYVEARFNHACETISKVIYRRQIPIVDKQIERIDKAVAKVQQDESKYGSAAQPSIPTDPSQEIRKYAIEKLEQAGDITSAKRLASVFGLDYVYDERAILLAAAMRRRRYLQFDDVLPGAVPSLVTTPQELKYVFSRLREEPLRHGPFGFDAEWDEETQGAAVLQLANAKMAVLIDVPALLGTEDGVKAMKSTVGTLFNCTDSVVAGFACRQDLQRLRASPSKVREYPERAESHHRHPWLCGTRAVVDVQSLVGTKEPKLFKAGLSRVCQHYFGKPLDKAEQCSLWSGRPLSEHQQAYAALDAWVCVAIYQKVNE